MNTLCAKYGLQGQLFATLPTVKRYRLFKQKAFDIVTFDIQREMSLLASIPDAKLQITVPTIGFTDPLLDYAPVPRFAVPLSVNDYVADESNMILAKVQVWGRDIAGNDYPLLRNASGKIDYALIQKQCEGMSLFSTLRSLTYIFNDKQVIQGNGLVSCYDPLLAGKMEFILFYRGCASLSFLVEVINQYGNVLQSRQIGYYPKQSHLPQAFFSHQGTIDCEADVANPYQYFRAYWECDLLLKDVMIRIKHYAGLSYQSLRALLETLIPAQMFFTVFTAQYSQEQIENRFDYHPHYQDTFYTHLIDSLMNQSLPLMALQNYFKHDAHDIRTLENLSRQWDEHDKLVFKSMLYPQQMNFLLKEDTCRVGVGNNPEDSSAKGIKQLSLEAFSDALDELISLRDPLLFATLQLPSEIEMLSLKDIQIRYALEDKERQWYSISCHQHATTPDTFKVYAKVMSARAKHQEEVNFRELGRK